MATLTAVPNIFANGTSSANLIDATQFNANFAAILGAYNNIYPSQILPTTAAQATFGATAAGVGYTITANDASATPLTVNGIAGQTNQLFNVFLTAGGQSVLRVTPGGVLNVSPAIQFGGNNPATINSAAVHIANDIAAVGGMALSVPTTSTNGFQWFVGGTAGTKIAQLNATGNLLIAPLIAGVNALGYVMPAYAVDGTQTQSSAHAVFGSVGFSGVNTVSVSLTNNAQFLSGSTWMGFATAVSQPVALYVEIKYGGTTCVISTVSGSNLTATVNFALFGT